MSPSYYVTPGGFHKSSKPFGKKYFLWKCWFFGKNIILPSLVFAFCFIVTYYIFVNCIVTAEAIDGEIYMGDCISLGSIFATFGSAIIAVLTLSSAQQLSSFETKISILNEEFSKAGISDWKRWEFLPRYSRQRTAQGGYEYFKLKNTIVHFTLEEQFIEIPVPTVLKDFKDIPVLRYWLRLWWKKRRYNVYTHKSNQLADMLIWNCLCSVYKNIILYRISQLGVWVGAAFVINSIVFAFFYVDLYTILQRYF